MGVQVPPSAPTIEVHVQMIWLVGTIHVIVCLILIGVVLLQQGKSADLAGAFGGQGSQTAFGPRGAANLLTKVTTWAAIIFMFTSIGLTVLIQRTSGPRSVLSGIKATHTTPAKPATPAK
jgi:preprotein translocase subunit SecG